MSPPVDRSARTSGRLRMLAGLAVSAVFLYFVVRDLEIEGFVDDLRHADYWWILPGIGVYFLAVVARTWRWSLSSQATPWRPVAVFARSWKKQRSSTSRRFSALISRRVTTARPWLRT